MDLPGNKFGTLNVIAYVHVCPIDKHTISGKHGGPGGFHGSPIVVTPTNVHFIQNFRRPSLSRLDASFRCGF